MIKSPIIVELENLYTPIGNQWVSRNSLVLNAARQSGIALGGSIAMAITRNKKHLAEFLDDSKRILCKEND